MSFLTGKWNFFLIGAIFALIFVFSFYLLDSTIGMSDAYTVMSEYCETVAENQELEELPVLDWQTGFLFGILLGGALAAFLCKDWKFNFFPEDRSNKKILPSIFYMLLQGFGGGFLVMLGLQLAGDSFLGHWSSMIQLSTPAFMFIMLFFIFTIGIKMILEGYKSNSGDSGK